MLRARSLALLILFVAGCSSSHLGDDDAGPASDAGPVRPVDAGPSPSDAGPRRLTRCAPEVGERVGEPCFCEGPAVRYGSAIYRQSIGIEVWDVSDAEAPVLAGQIEERPASAGGLAVVAGHLLSVSNFSPDLTVYDLADPLRPRRVAELPIDGENVSDLAVWQGFGEGLAVLVDQGASEVELIGVDLGDPTSPRELYRVPVQGRVASLLLDGARLFVTTREPSPARGWLEVRDPRTGALVGRHLLDEGDASWYSDLALHRGRLLRTTTDAIEILDVDGEAPIVVARVELGSGQPTTVDVSGDLAIVGGSALVILDLTDPSRPRELGRAETAIGDIRAIAGDAEHVFVSSGNGLTPIALRCE